MALLSTIDMHEVSVPRVLISGTAQGVGKSLLALGLGHEFKRRGVAYSSCVVGPALAQAILHRRLAGRYVRCLDERMLTASQNLFGLAQAASGAELILIEGHDGLYDGAFPGGLRGSDAEIAALTGTPVVLVADARGFANSIAAVIKGYSDLAQGFLVAGTVLNRLPSGQHAQVRKNFEVSLEWQRLRPLIGALPELTLSAVPPPAFLTEGHNFTSMPRQFYVDIGAAVGAYVDVESVIQTAGLAQPLPAQNVNVESGPRRTRIAVSEDGCFAYCFQDNLELLRLFGAELVSFSPLADTELPDRIGGVYLTGAFLPEYAAELSNNTAMHKSLRSFAERGGVIYAEGGGAAYLAREWRVHDPRSAKDVLALPGVGILPATVTHTDSRMTHTAGCYAEAVTVEESILGRGGQIVKGYITGEWRVSREERLMKVLRVSRSGQPSLHEGYSPSAQIVATFCFAHFGSNLELARSIVDAAEVVSPMGRLGR